MGAILRADCNFKDSPVGILNQYLRNPKEMLKFVDTSSFITNSLIDELEFENSFYALAAPSFEGKTQFAFVIDSVRPLYFALNQYETDDSLNIQQIYLNFESLNLAIQKFSEKDIETIKSILKLNELNYQHIAGGQLKTKYSNTPFWILGFLAALIMDAESNFDQNAPGNNWMKFHAHRKNLKIVPTTIEKFQETIQSKCSGYCLFLDEFIGINWAVLIRNLARVIGLRCIVANTNTEIANITGKAQSLMSRTELNNVWSIVITRLNYANWTALNEILQANTIFQRIRERFSCDPNSLKVINEFLRRLVENEFKWIRPGIAVYVIKSLMAFLEETQSFDFGVLINYVFDYISSEIKFRKFRIFTQELGILANVGLLTPIAYVKDGVIDPEELFKRVEFLRDHLYYLINPSDNTNWVFITIYPEADRKYLSIYKNFKKIAWDFEICFFNEKDVFTSLACIFITFERPIASILEAALKVIDRSPRSIGNAVNVEALSLNGNSLEVMAAASIVDSTHHGFNENSSNLFGQGGVIFMNNLIQNLISNIDYKKNFRLLEGLSNAPLICSKPISKFLDTLFFPFLCPFNCEIPSLLKFAASQTNLIKIGSFFRTANSTKIDGKFDIFTLNSEGAFVPSVAIVECKNWKEPLDTGELAKILIKAESHNGPICFIFCSHTVKDPQTDSILYNYCHSRNILLYRIKKENDHYQFSFVKFFNNLETTPKMTGFIIELDEINS